MIRTAWFALVLFFSSALHASGVIVAALVGVKRRPGGVYDCGTNDWSRDQSFVPQSYTPPGRRFTPTSAATITPLACSALEKKRTRANQAVRIIGRENDRSRRPTLSVFRCP